MHSDPRSHPFHQRYRQRALFARDVEASIEIDAPREQVWRTLIDFEAYPDWNPFTRSVSTTLEVGAPVHLGVEMPGRAYSDRIEWVNLVDPGHTLCWGMQLGHPTLLVANRWQELQDLPDGRTRYHTVDRFSGLLVPVMLAIYAEPMRRGFESVGTSLKAHLEAAASADRSQTPFVAAEGASA